MKFFAACLFALATIGNAHALETPQENPARALRTKAETQPAAAAESARSLKIGPGAVGDAAISTFSIAQSIVPLLGEMFKKKECHQTACWVAAPTEACGMAAANRAQHELMKGRNSFAVESTGATGMWVRYWRTQFAPPDRGMVADGKCDDGRPYQVTNCQSTGKVYC